MHCFVILINLFLFIGIKIGNKVGPRISVLITLKIQFISYFLLIIAKNYYVFLIFMEIFEIGSAISNLTSIRNCWKYYPNNHGFINGIIVNENGICSLFLTSLADFVIINPEKEGTDDNGIYLEKTEIEWKVIYISLQKFLVF